MAARQSSAQQVPPGSILLVVHDFVARSPDELSLAKGDRIELIERDDDFGDGWFLGRHMNNGNTGLFPEVYTTPAPRGTLLSTPAVRRNGHPQSLDSPASTSIPSVPDHQPALSSPSSLPSLQPLTQQRTSQSHNSVMHETLSVIDEHITDMRSPRHSNPSASNNANQDADSIYSQHADNRLSYINGHETDQDEDDNRMHTEAEVNLWSPDRVAEYLEDNGVEKSHCDTFREQEISGEVLLTMEQTAIFIKEFELGSVGRRLKTWQKIKALQDEVRNSSAHVPRSVSEYSAMVDEAQNEANRRRSQSINVPQYRPVSGVPSIMSRPENTQRPSAASIRNMNHSRRHSSMGSIESTNIRHAHHRHSSIGAGAAAAPTVASRRLSVAQEPPAELPDFSLSHAQHDGVAEYGFGALPSPNDIDRGYFSGNEADARQRRNVLQKKATAAHSRNASAVTDSARHSATYKNFPRMSSVDSMRDPVSPVMSPESSHFVFNKPSSNRAVSGPAKPFAVAAHAAPVSPIVTKLEHSFADSDASSPLNPSPSPASASYTRSFFSKPRIGGLRIASDAITQNEKKQSARKHEPLASPARTGSTTPSTENPSFDLQKSDNQSRVSTGSSGALAPPPIGRMRPKARNKKSTSAYTRGLEKKGPAEQMLGADYSGWMKKKSSSLVGSWKPRLFVLRGRRLSYYYSENDTEEKGLIDISSHRVLPAENEKITGFHLAITSAAASPMTPQLTQTSAASDLKANPPLTPSDGQGQGLFIFKLVPPRQGLSKAVNFTKPTVHYFAVSSRQEGRLWMAALMKATIDYDSSGKVVTSYSQNTISLAKAQARNERPPALKDIMTPPDVVHEIEAARPESRGLGIGGIDLSEPTEPGAERNGRQSVKSTAGT